MNALDVCDGRVLCQRRGNRFASLWTDVVATKPAKEEERERVEGVSVLVIIKQCPPCIPTKRRELRFQRRQVLAGGMNALDGCDGRVLCQRRGNRFASLWIEVVVSKAEKEEDRERVEV